MAVFDIDIGGASAGGVFDIDLNAPPPKPVERGIFGTIASGARSAARSVGATVDTIQGDNAELATAVEKQQAEKKDHRLQGFLDSVSAWKKEQDASGKEPSWWDTARGLAGAAWDNPAGAGLQIAEQLPNAAVALGSAAAGAAVGSLAGPVGTIAGGLAGLFAGNTALETGGKALERAAEGPLTDDVRAQVLKEGAIKGGVITAVDAVTLGATKFITGAARRAAEAATTRVLTDAGINVTDKVAVDTALKTPELVSKVQAAQQVAVKATNTAGMRIARLGGAGALETFGEGFGEYVGEYAATGKADKMEALIEAFSSAGQSAAEIAFTSSLNKINSPKKILDAKDTDGAIDAFKFGLEGTPVDREAILAKYRPGYKDHTPEEVTANQATLESAVENEVTFAKDDTGKATLSGTPLEVVPAQNLPTEAGEVDRMGAAVKDGVPQITITKTNLLTRDAYEAIAALNRAQGKSTIVFKDGPGVTFEGFASTTRHPNVAFISDRMNTDPVVIAAHEVQHLLDTGSEKFKDFSRVVGEELTAQATEVAKERHGDLATPKLMAEVRADIAGDAWADPTFHGRVIENMKLQLGDKAAETQATGLLEGIKELIQRVKAVLTGTTFTSPNGQRLATQYVTNLERVHDALAAAIADHFITQGYRPPGAQTNTSQVLVSRALALQAEKTKAADTPGFQRTPEQLIALKATVAPPAGASPALVSALEAAQKAPFDRTTEERLNLEAIRVGVQMSAKQTFDGMTLRPQKDDVKVQAASAFADKPHRILPGVSEVAFKDVTLQGDFDTPDKKIRVRELAAQIKRNGSIEPLLVAKRADGTQYVAEGQHRARALQALGYDRFPARVAVETEQKRESVNTLGATGKVPPDRYTASVSEVKKHPGWFNFVVRRNGMPIQFGAGTMYESREKAQRHGNEVVQQYRDAIAESPKPATQGTFLNVGLSTKEVRGDGTFITKTDVLRALHAVGVKVLKTDVHDSNTEPTAVVQIDRGMTVPELDALSAALYQQAIPQLHNGVGVMAGPEAENWGPFDPAQFKMPDGRWLSEHQVGGISKSNKKATKDPRTGVALTKQQRMASLDDTVYGDRPPTQFKKQTELGELLQDLSTTYEPARTKDTPENREFVARVLEHEVRLALGQDANAMEWYGRTLDDAFAVAAIIHPEIATSEEARFAFSYALAVTSNGHTIVDNVKNAFAVYAAYNRKTHTMPDMGFGIRHTAMRIAFQKWNEQVREHGSVAGYQNYLLTKHTVADMEKVAPNRREKVGDTLYGGTIIGSKIGGGFLVNLNKLWDAIAMDRWFMRTWGRVTGRMIMGDGSLIADPGNAGTKHYVRAVMDMVLERVQEDHPSATIAGLQATLWYPEKDLYSMHGVNDEAPTDYAIEVANYAKTKGISQASIAAATGANASQPAGRSATDRQRGAGEADQGVRLSPKQSAGASRERRLAEVQRAAEAARGATKLVGLPDAPLLVNGEWYVPGPIKVAQDAARDYAGRDYTPPTTYVESDPVRGKAIADAFDAMEHAPNNPEVKAAYQALSSEILGQWRAMKATGVSVRFADRAGEQEYIDSLATEDLPIIIKELRDANQLNTLLSTDVGFGLDSASYVADNPLMAFTDELIGGKPARINDLLRAVHDYFGHFKDGIGFTPAGEENAWRMHRAMFTPAARRALATETTGQASWYAYGPHGAANLAGKAKDAIYAPQKTGLLPEWVSEDGIQKSPKPLNLTGVHFSQQPRATLNGSLAGTGLTGEETKRILNSPDKRLRSRVNAYINQGGGVTPERGVGTYPHVVDMRNLYDANSDPLDIASNDTNKFESAVLNAGFGGYYNRERGSAVLLGDAAKSVPAELKPTNYRGVDIPVPPGPEYTPLQQVARAIVGSKLLPGGQRTGAEWKSNPELQKLLGDGYSVSKLEDDKLYYADGVAKLVSDKAPTVSASPKQLLAPNGKPSKLEPRLHAMVRTPAFKRWFGDWEKHALAANPVGSLWSDDKVSKVVDENGEPLVVYHGTVTGGFTEFSMNTQRGRVTASFFAEDPDMARSYSGTRQDIDLSEGGADQYARQQRGIYKVFLNIRNPNEKDFEGANWDGQRVGQYEVVEGNDSGDFDAERLYDDGGRGYFDDLSDAEALAEAKGGVVRPADDHYDTTNGVVKEAIRMGYDGAIIRQVVDNGPADGAYDPGTVYAVLHPNQVKSIENKGKFSKKNDILLSPKSPAFKRWFGDSKVVDEKGEPLVVYHGTPVRGFKVFDIDSSYERAAYFTPNKKIANDFAVDADTLKRGRVVSVYLSLQNPKVIDLAGGAFQQSADQTGLLAKEFDKARAEGHDGAVLIGVDEFGGADTQYAVFHPNQIKSVFNENPTSNPDISKSPKSRNDRIPTREAIAQAHLQPGYLRLKGQEDAAYAGYIETDQRVSEEALNALRKKAPELFQRLDAGGGAGSMRYLARQIAGADKSPEVQASWAEYQDAKNAAHAFVADYVTDNGEIPAQFPDSPNPDRQQINTPAFKAWFKNSKATMNGRPLVGVHGTRYDITRFATVQNRDSNRLSGDNWMGQLGTWFAAPSESSSYEPGNETATADGFAEARGLDGGVVYPVFLSIQNPAEYEGYEDLLDARDEVGGGVQLRKKLIAAGHDGIVVRDSATDGDAFRDDWVAFEPNQIKSVFNENPTSNPDISKSPKNPFPDSKVQQVVYHGTGADFAEFAPQEDAHFGFHFGTQEQANKILRGTPGARVLPVYIDLRAPLRTTEPMSGDWGNAHAVALVLDKKLGGDTFERMSLENISRGRVGPEARQSILSETAVKLQSLGYDGIVYKNRIEGKGDSYIVFNHEQIRSAISGVQMSPKTTGASGRALTAAQEQAFRNVGRTVEVPTIAQRIATLRQDIGKKIVQGMVDQFAPLKDLSPIAYLLARLSKGSAGAFEAMLKHGKISINGGAYDADRSGGFIDKVLIPLQGEAHDWLWWMAAHRAAFLKKEDREHLFKDTDIAALRELDRGTLKSEYTLMNGTKTRERALAFQDSAVKYDAFNKNVLDMAEQSGLIKQTYLTPEGEVRGRAQWEKMMYVPFYRVAEDDGFVGGNISAKLVGQSPFKRLKGGEEKLNNDLLENVLANWFHLLDAGVKNRAAKEALESAVAVGAATESDAETVKQMAKAGGGKGVWFLDNGVKRHFAVGDKMLLTAITSLQFAGLKGPVMDAMGTMKHILTVGVTASPYFKVKNLIRDSMQAVATAPIGYNPITNIREGIAAGDRAGQTYVSMLASGGLIRFGTMLEGKASRQVDQLVRLGVKKSTILTDDSLIRNVYDKMDVALTAYNELGNRGEEINRAALYTQLIKKGVPHAEAALQARDLMDFSLQGSNVAVRFLTQVVPFMNARMQGLYKLGRGAAQDPKRFATVLGAAAVVSIGRPVKLSLFA